MRVQIIDAEIPEGYTYKRADRFTKAEFIAEFRKEDRKAAKNGQMNIRKRCTPSRTFTGSEMRHPRRSGISAEMQAVRFTPPTTGQARRL